jgi:hypothetical protein
LLPNASRQREAVVRKLSAYWHHPCLS